MRLRLPPTCNRSKGGRSSGQNQEIIIMTGDGSRVTSEVTPVGRAFGHRPRSHWRGPLQEVVNKYTVEMSSAPLNRYHGWQKMTNAQA
ncbi:unnamed protein product [Arctogadus glacialis]